MLIPEYNEEPIDPPRGLTPNNKDESITRLSCQDVDDHSLFFPAMDSDSDSSSSIATVSDDASLWSDEDDEPLQEPESKHELAVEMLEEAEAREEEDTSDFVIYGIPKAFIENAQEQSSEEEKLIDEEAEHAAKKGAFHDPFIIGLALFWDVYGLTREAYTAFPQLSSLASADTLKKLPESLDALHRWNDKRLPKMELRSKRVPMDLKTLPGGE